VIKNIILTKQASTCVTELSVFITIIVRTVRRVSGSFAPRTSHLYPGCFTPKTFWIPPWRFHILLVFTVRSLPPSVFAIIWSSLIFSAPNALGVKRQMGKTCVTRQKHTTHETLYTVIVTAYKLSQRTRWYWKCANVTHLKKCRLELPKKSIESFKVGIPALWETFGQSHPKPRGTYPPCATYTRAAF